MKSVILRLAVFVGAAVLVWNIAGVGDAQSGGLVAKPAQAKAPAPVLAGFPFTNESLAYTVNWPSGLNLGEGHMSAVSDAGGWHFELSLDAGIPGFAVKDTYRAHAGADLCSTSLSKDFSHGSRKSTETVTIDRATSTATRLTKVGDKNGGTSKVMVPDCIHDALTYLYYARRELGQGRVPPAQEIIFGAIYNMSLQYAGAETISVNDKRILTDKMICHVKGPASDLQFDAYFDRDPARTPVAIRVPLSMGKFSLELVR